MKINSTLCIDNKIIITIGFDIGIIIMLYYKHYAKPGSCMILFRIRQTSSLFNKNSFKLSLNTALGVLLSISLERAFQKKCLKKVPEI